ncbi:MAG: outer membrane beta-barrel family protein, partial [Muribaculaceae bacterium]
NMVNAPMDYTGINSHFDLNFLEQTFQLDWSRPYGRIHKLDLGAKFIQRNNDSRNTRYYTGAGNTYDDFTHRTSIGAVYADWRATFGRVSLRAGIRYEYSHLSAKFRTGDMRHFGSNLNDFAPNAAVNWNINDANTLKLSYNRRINRPGISYLDPTVSVSPLVTSSGNPDLGSSAYNAVTLNYTLIRPRITLDASVSGTISNNAIAQVKTVENQHTYYTYDNVDHYRQLRLSAYAQWTPWDKTRIVVNASGGPVRYHRPSAKLSETVWQSHIYLNIQQTIPWKIILRANAGFFGGYGSLYTRSKNNASSIWHSIGVQRNFLKEDRLSVSIFINNPFGPNTLDYTSETFNTDYVSRSTTTYNYRRDVGISIRYRFGSLTASVKKTKASISNDDLTGGKK